MIISGNVELHTMNKQVVECSLIQLSTLYDVYKAHYRTKNDGYNIMVFYDEEGNQIVDDSTSTLLILMCENYRIRKCIIEGVNNMPYKNYLCKVIENALTNRELITIESEIDEVRRCICAFLPQLDIEVAQRIARKIVRNIYKEV